MESESNIYKTKIHELFSKKQILTISAIIILLTFLSLSNYYLFHSVAEVFSCAIAYTIFMFSINTYKISKNNFFIILGIGYLFSAVMDMLHTFSYGDIIIFINESYDADTKFWIAARIIEAWTFFIASALLHKNNIRCNYYYIFFGYFVITAIMIIDVLYLNTIIPTLRIDGFGITKYKIYLEYVLISVFFISLLLTYKARNKLNHAIFSFLILALILKIISELFFTMYFNITDCFNLIGHLLKVCSSYFIYIGILENGINRPFDILNNNLRDADNKFREKELQRKYLEEIIIQNEHCYDLIIDNSSNCIFIINDEKIAYANKTMLDTIKAENQCDLIGRSIWEFIQTDSEHEAYLIKLKENINNTKFVVIDLIGLDGSKLKFEYSLNNITYRGKHAYLVVLRNISQREEIKSLKNDLNKSEKKLSQSKELNRELTEFFSNISHELKTPLNIILGSIQLINQYEKELITTPNLQRQNSILKIMRQNAFRLVRLVNNLIDISKYDVGYLKLNLHNYNIVSIVEDITLSVSDYYKMKYIKIIFDTNTEEKIMAVDCDKIERIMLNLLSNSIKFTDKGGEISVNFTDMGDYVQVSVKDTGIGIPEEKLKTIFNRFEQVDKTFTRKREGSGIGLALVKSLVEIHGGSINVISKINEGSEFIIELPVTIIENEETDIELTYESKVDKINIEFSDIYS